MISASESMQLNSTGRRKSSGLYMLPMLPPRVVYIISLLARSKELSDNEWAEIASST